MWDSPQPPAGTCCICRFPISQIGNLLYIQVPDLQTFPKSGTCRMYRFPIWETGNLFMIQVPDLANREPVYTTGSRELLGEIPNRVLYSIVLMIPFVTVPPSYNPRKGGYRAYMASYADQILASQNRPLTSLGRGVIRRKNCGHISRNALKCEFYIFLKVGEAARMALPSADFS